MEYNIVVTRKRIKNMIIRITRDGEVRVSVPVGVSEKSVSDFIVSRKGWIEKNLVRTLRGLRNSRKNFETGDRIRILGKIYTLQVMMSNENKVELEERDADGGDLFLSVSMYNDTDIRRVVLYDWLKDKLSHLLAELTKKYGDLTGYYPKEIKIREMKSLWGSCNVRTKKITYNFTLIEKPLKAVEYVVLHEISHMPYPDHQEGFWDFVSRFMPDWKKRKKLLSDS